MKRVLILLTLLGTACGGPTAAECASNTDTYTSYGQAFLTTTCRSCHEHASQFSTQAAVQASLTQLEAEISSGKMPEGTSLTTAERTRVLTWLGCGAP
jgi:hypothetical protein